MVPEGSLPYSQELATGPYPEQTETNSHINFIKMYFSIRISSYNKRHTAQKKYYTLYKTRKICMFHSKHFSTWGIFSEIKGTSNLCVSTRLLTSLIAGFIKLRVAFQLISCQNKSLYIIKSKIEDGCLLDCCAVSGIILPTFQRYLLPPSSRQRRNNQEQSHRHIRLRENLKSHKSKFIQKNKTVIKLKQKID
jgi:hypothetical protein